MRPPPGFIDITRGDRVEDLVVFSHAHVDGEQSLCLNLTHAEMRFSHGPPNFYAPPLGQVHSSV